MRRATGTVALLCLALLVAGSRALPGRAAPRPKIDPLLERAAAWMAAFPREQLHFDAAVGLMQIRRRADDPALGVAFERAREVADRDSDNPMRRFYDDGYRATPDRTSRWEVPGAGAPRVNVNRVVLEALYCAENGLRPQTLEYVAGPMRDGGGYYTTHALWALAIARDRGCLSKTELDDRARPLVEELRSAQPAKPESAALAVDLFAERLLMVVLAAGRDARTDSWAAALMEAQQPDGAFGSLATGEDPYHRFHATMMSAWALVDWDAARPAHR